MVFELKAATPWRGVHRELDKLIAAKNASPLVVGLGDGETFIASDIPALLSHTRSFIYLHEQEMAVLTPDGAALFKLDGTPFTREPKHITWTPSQAEKGGYKHFMLKEIHEQPRAMVDTLRGRMSLETGDVHLEDMSLDDARVRQIDRFIFAPVAPHGMPGLWANALSSNGHVSP